MEAFYHIFNLKSIIYFDQGISIKAKKDFAKADEIRDKIEERGYEIEDLPDGGYKLLKISN